MLFFKKFFWVLLFAGSLSIAGSGFQLERLATALEQLSGEDIKQHVLDDLMSWSTYCFSTIPEGLCIYYPLEEDVELARKKHFFIPFPFKTEITNLAHTVFDDYTKQVITLGNWMNKAEKPSLNEWKYEGLLTSDYVILKKFEENDELCVIGDIHGSIHSLLRLLWDLFVKGYLSRDFKIKKPHFYMIFLGDYIDRGSFGLEVLYTLLRLRKENPNTVILLRGNHDNGYGEEGYHTLEPSASFTFGSEFFHRFATDFKNDPFAPLFGRLPIALFATCNDYVIQFCHGGMMMTFGDDNLVVSYDALDNNWSCTGETYRCIPDKKMANMLFWGDFNQTNLIGGGYGWVGRTPVGSALVPKIAAKQGISAFVRGHQHGNYTLKLLPPFTALKNDIVVWWQTVVNPVLKDEYLKQGFPLKSNDYLPVFTFSTATAWNLSSYEGFGIISLGKTFSDCRLRLHERQILALERLSQPPETAGTLTSRLNELNKEVRAYEPMSLSGKDSSCLYSKVLCDTQAQTISVSWHEKSQAKPVVVQ